MRWPWGKTREPASEWRYPGWVAYEPGLVPPPELMAMEGIGVLEEWFRWAEEWSMLLRFLGGLGRDSSVLEIGCGLGRTAFPLRYVLSAEGTYDGFDISRPKIDFAKRTFQAAHPNFRFRWSDLHNTHYNPSGRLAAKDYRFPFEDDAFDVVYAASVFTHLLPPAAERYLREAARVLRPGGRLLVSFFLLDQYRPGAPRPLGFARAAFDFDHSLPEYGRSIAISNPADPEEMTAYRLDWILGVAGRAGLSLLMPERPGFWSGTTQTWISAQDLLLLGRPMEDGAPAAAGDSMPGVRT